MSMKVQIERDACGNIIIQMLGDISYDNAAPLRQELQEILQQNPTVDVTINMQNVDFVGSSGIKQFVETLKIVNQKHTKVKLSNVRSEFIKVFKLYELTDEDLKTIIDDFENDETEDLSLRYGRPLTFHN